MQPPAALLKKGITSLPCIGDGRQSGTSGSPSILNATPEAAAGGGLALLKTGDRDLSADTLELVQIEIKLRTVIYVNPILDITQDVIAALNAGSETPAQE